MWNVYLYIPEVGPNCRICSNLFPYLFLLVNVLCIEYVVKQIRIKYNVKMLPQSN